MFLKLSIVSGTDCIFDYISWLRNGHSQSVAAVKDVAQCTYMNVRDETRLPSYLSKCR